MPMIWVYSEFMYIKIQYIEYNIVTLGTSEIPRKTQKVKKTYFQCGPQYLYIYGVLIKILHIINSRLIISDNTTVNVLITII